MPGQWLSARLVRLRQCHATDARLASEMPGSMERDRRRRSGWRTTCRDEMRYLNPGLFTIVYSAFQQPPTCVMLRSVSLGQAERSSSCSRLRASREAPACCLNCCRSLCVTSSGRSSHGKRGGLKKPMLPKVRVNLGPLSPCRTPLVLLYVKQYRHAVNLCDGLRTPTVLTVSWSVSHLVVSTIPSRPQSVISLHQPSRRTSSFCRYAATARTDKSVTLSHDVKSSSRRVSPRSWAREKTARS